MRTVKRQEPQSGFQVTWLNRSGQRPLRQNSLQFECESDALKFAFRLASSKSNSRATVQIKVGTAWKLVLGFTSPTFESSREHTN